MDDVCANNIVDASAEKDKRNGHQIYAVKDMTE